MKTFRTENLVNHYFLALLLGELTKSTTPVNPPMKTYLQHEHEDLPISHIVIYVTNFYRYGGYDYTLPFTLSIALVFHALNCCVCWFYLSLCELENKLV